VHLASPSSSVTDGPASRARLHSSASKCSPTSTIFWLTSRRTRTTQLDTVSPTRMPSRSTQWTPRGHVSTGFGGLLSFLTLVFQGSISLCVRLIGHLPSCAVMLGAQHEVIGHALVSIVWSLLTHNSPKHTVFSNVRSVFVPRSPQSAWRGIYLSEDLRVIGHPGASASGTAHVAVPPVVAQSSVQTYIGRECSSLNFRAQPIIGGIDTP